MSGQLITTHESSTLELVLQWSHNDGAWYDTSDHVKIEQNTPVNEIIAKGGDMLAHWVISYPDPEEKQRIVLRHTKVTDQPVMIPR